MLSEGQSIPKFSLTDSSGVRRGLDPKAPYTVLYFYPKDDTPGCTIQAKEFSASLAAFRRLGVDVFGISGGTDKSKASFCAKHNLSVPLLSDSDFSLAKAVGAYGDKKFMGRSYQGIFRATFIVDAKGRIRKVFDTVQAGGHAEEVLATIRTMIEKGEEPPPPVVKAVKAPTSELKKKPVIARSVKSRSGGGKVAKKKTAGAAKSKKAKK